jgi:HD-GYP domain-containing protein (c-di-GMP phosphodiesterase class II)
MNLNEELKGITGNKRKYLLLRIADMDAKTARDLTGIEQGTYNTWLHQEDFIAIHRRLDELTEHRQEAVQMLRRKNQFDAVLLEGKMLKKMQEELDSGEYDFLRTNLAREVYSKLMTELDATPKVLALSWEERMMQINNNISKATELPIKEQPTTIEGEFTIPEEPKLITDSKEI